MIKSNDNEDLRDRFDIPLFPSFMYFSLDGEMHPFIGYRTIDNITDWINSEKWKELEAQFTVIPDRPTTKSIFKRYLRRIFSPIPVNQSFFTVDSFVLSLVFWFNCCLMYMGRQVALKENGRSSSYQVRTDSTAQREGGTRVERLQSKNIMTFELMRKNIINM